MKNNCQFNTAKFYQYDCIPHETTNCYRIITDNGVYFFMNTNLSMLTS